MNNKRVSVLQIAAISAAGHAVIGLLCVWSAFALLMLAHMSPQNPASDALTANIDEMAFTLLMAFPLGFALVGFVSGAAACHFRNFYVQRCTGPSKRRVYKAMPAADAIPAASQAAAA